MGNSIKPNIERAEKTGACNLSLQNLREVCDLFILLIIKLKADDRVYNTIVIQYNIKIVEFRISRFPLLR